MAETDVSAAWRVSKALRDRATRCLVASEAEPLRSQPYYPDSDVDLDFSGHLTIAALITEIMTLRNMLKAERQRHG